MAGEVSGLLSAARATKAPHAAADTGHSGCRGERLRLKPRAGAAGAAAQRILKHLELLTEPRKFRRARPPPKPWDAWFDDVPNDDWC